MNSNPYATEVEEHEIIESELDKPFGKRLTKVRCVVCEAFLSEALLCDLRKELVPLRHYDCKAEKIYHISGDDVRQDTDNDRVLEATRDIYIGKVHMFAGNLAWYNGKSIVTRPCGYTPICDEETNDTGAVECALRRGWLKPYVKPEDKPINKAVVWLKSLVSKTQRV